MKVTLNHMFETASGKLCSKSGTYVALNKQTGKMYQAEYHEREYRNTEKQQEVKQPLPVVPKPQLHGGRRTNPLSRTPPAPRTTRSSSSVQGPAQDSNPYSYLRSLVQDDLTIQLGGSSTTTVPGGSPSGDNQGGTTTPPVLD